ncbi:MAG: precorrin-3B C(17)-methyltransferase [Planctomycetaceae bacterium]|nr:precorrin-3B C(17)-methyltransferase [Planctomycetaceae bacterium]
MNKLYIVGIGPGDRENMTDRAFDAMEEAEVLCGYNTYIDLVTPIFPLKERIATGMTREVERCREALATAAAGRTVAVVCSGDAGVYGMAGLLFELSADYPPVEIEIVPGVSAAMAGAAVLGAPLMHDFAVVSLSDLLTPWDTIAIRLEHAAAADFVLCLYNPSSKKRRDHLARACDIVLRHRTPATVCGWVRNIGREGQESDVLTLGELRDWEADMFTTVFIGSSSTRNIDGRMVTPRGYGEAGH